VLLFFIIIFTNRIHKSGCIAGMIAIFYTPPRYWLKLFWLLWHPSGVNQRSCFHSCSFIGIMLTPTFIQCSPSERSELIDKWNILLNCKEQSCAFFKVLHNPCFTYGATWSPNNCADPPVQMTSLPPPCCERWKHLSRSWWWDDVNLNENTCSMHCIAP
jgi:hypothetical protein